jgi:hypothetical protein
MERNYGILASIDWNSRNWQGMPTEDDLKTSSYGYVMEKHYTHTFLNFAHELYPPDKNGYHYGLLPQLWSKEPDRDKARYVEVVFMKSRNWRDTYNYMVGFYAFPVFGKTIKACPVPEFRHDLELNVKAFPKDIHLLKNYINLDLHPERQLFLPIGKQMGKQGYNYLTRENVFKILDVMTSHNLEDDKLKGIKYQIIKEIGG